VLTARLMHTKFVHMKWWHCMCSDCVHTYFILFYRASVLCIVLATVGVYMDPI